VYLSESSVELCVTKNQKLTQRNTKMHRGSRRYSGVKDQIGFAFASKYFSASIDQINPFPDTIA
jgi:hypothetical protein